MRHATQRCIPYVLSFLALAVVTGAAPVRAQTHEATAQPAAVDRPAAAPPVEGESALDQPSEGEPDVAAPPPQAEAEDAGETPAGGEPSGALNYTLIQLVQFGGIVGYVIISLSVVAVALIVDYALLLRPKVLMPPAEVEQLRSLAAERRWDEIVAEPRASFVGAVMAAGVAERDRGYEASVKAMEDRGDELTGRLLRRIEYLNMIANVAPMLGLLGTVIGMVMAFNQISIAAGGADPRQLAAGIFQALMTTVMGLVVAIPAFFAFSLFRNRVDSLVAEATATAEDLVTPLRSAAQPAEPAPRMRRA